MMKKKYLMVLFATLLLLVGSTVVSACYRKPIIIDKTKNYYTSSSGGSINTQKLSLYMSGDHMMYDQITTEGYEYFTLEDLDPPKMYGQESKSFFGWINHWFVPRSEYDKLLLRVEALEKQMSS